MATASYYWPITEPYHPSNVGWNGCSEIASTRNNTQLISSFGTALPKQSALAIIGPSLPFSIAESTMIREFLQDNGTVILADDRGSGNSLLRELNVSASFDGKSIADLYAYDKNPSFPLLSNFSPSRFSENVSAVILDHPSYLDVWDKKQVKIIASSSPFSFIDIRGAGEPAQNESVDSYPIVAYTEIGAGTLVLISDASVFINDIVGLHDNLQLFKNFLRPDGETLLFDVAHLANAPITNTHILIRDSLGAFVRLVAGNFYLPGVLIMLVLTVGVLFHQRRQKWMRKGDSHVLYSPPWLEDSNK